MDTLADIGQIRIAVAGAATPCGCEALRSLSQWHRVDFSVAVDQHEFGKCCRDFAGPRAANLTVEEKLGVALEKEPCDVLIDFSHSAAALTHGVSALKRGVRPILNATFSGPELRDLRDACAEAGLPAIVAPHLSLSEVLSLRFARWAARWMTDLEVIDVNPDFHQDKPSPMAKAIAEAIADGWEERELAVSGGIDAAPNKTWEDVRLHKLHLKGAGVRQEIRCGTTGEALSVCFEPKDSTAIIEGLKLAISSIMTMSGLTVGLDKLLFPSDRP
jgi:4-hydroxy-tetrahydrodipicolinate reductase